MNIKIQKLLDLLREMESCLVAFSGGVDSSVLARAAKEALGDRAIAVLCVSQVITPEEIQLAEETADLIGIHLEVIQTDVLANPGFVRNEPDRCYDCKKFIFGQIKKLGEELGISRIVDGSNADDKSVHRPGSQALAEMGVSSPLAECDLSKQEIRAQALEWGMPEWDRISSPCTQTRIAFGELITAEQLERIQRAERQLKASYTWDILRVRVHGGDLARIETTQADMDRNLATERDRQAVADLLRGLGYRFVTIDLGGYQQGCFDA